MYFICKDKNQVKTCDEHFSKVQTVAIGKDHIVEVVGLCNRGIMCAYVIAHQKPKSKLI